MCEYTHDIQFAIGVCVEFTLPDQSTFLITLTFNDIYCYYYTYVYYRYILKCDLFR